MQFNIISSDVLTISSNSSPPVSEEQLFLSGTPLCIVILIVNCNVLAAVSTGASDLIPLRILHNSCMNIPATVNPIRNRKDKADKVRISLHKTQISGVGSCR